MGKIAFKALQAAAKLITKAGSSVAKVERVVTKTASSATAKLAKDTTKKALQNFGRGKSKAIPAPNKGFEIARQLSRKADRAKVTAKLSKNQIALQRTLNGKAQIPTNTLSGADKQKQLADYLRKVVSDTKRALKATSIKPNAKSIGKAQKLRNKNTDPVSGFTRNLSSDRAKVISDNKAEALRSRLFREKNAKSLIGMDSSLPNPKKGISKPKLLAKKIKEAVEDVDFNKKGSLAPRKVTEINPTFNGAKGVVALIVGGTIASAGFSLFKATSGKEEEDKKWAKDRIADLNRETEERVINPTTPDVKNGSEIEKERKDKKKDVSNKQKAVREKAKEQAKAKLDAGIEKLKNLDNEERDKNKAAEDTFGDETKSQVDSLKAQFKEDLANAPKGTKTKLRKEQAEQLKAYRADRKAGLAALKAAGKAKVLKIKNDASDAAKKLRGLAVSLQSDGEITAFYTDRNGKVRPISTARVA